MAKAKMQKNAPETPQSANSQNGGLSWLTDRRPIDSLRPYEHNPRKISKAAVQKLKRSISEDGYHAPIIINTDGTIIGGHMRWQAMKELGYTEVDVRLPSRPLTAEEFDRINLRDNVAFGEWDSAILGFRFELDFLSDMGLPENIVDAAARSKHQKNEPEGDPDDAPDAPDTARTKLGDVYSIGKHVLVCGDSTKTDVVGVCMQEGGGIMADQLVTDPPYNVAYTGKTKDALTIQNDSMDDGQFRQFLTDAFAAADSGMKEGATFYVWHADSEGLNFRAACQAVGWKVRQCLVWVKNTMVMGRQDYQWKHEPCLYGWKEGASHLWASDRKQTTALNFDKPSRNAEHPTMKPVELIGYQIGNNTKGGDIVLDIFGGSGTTMVAAHMGGRFCRMVELDPRYCDVIVTRMLLLFPALRDQLKLNGKPINWKLPEVKHGKP